MKENGNILVRLTRFLQGNNLQAAFVVLFVLFLLPWNGIPSMGGYVAAQYFLTYADGFMRGAFAGTVSTLLIVLAGSSAFFTGLYLLTVFGYVVGAVVWMTAFLRSRNREILMLLFLLILALPNTYMALTGDFGRLDFLIYGLEFLACTWIERESKFRCLVPVIILVCVLIAEEAFLMVLPLVIAVICWKNDFRKKGTLSVTVGSAAALLAALAISWYFRTYPIPSYIVESNILQRNVSDYPAYFVPVEQNETLSESIERIWIYCFCNGEKTVEYAFSFLFYGIAMILPLWVWLKFFRNGGFRKKSMLLFLAAFCPLILCLFQTEWNRFFTASLTAHFIALSLLLTDPLENIVLPVPGNKKSILLFLPVLFFLPQGKSTATCFSSFSKFMAGSCYRIYKSVREKRIPELMSLEKGKRLMKEKKYAEAAEAFRVASLAGIPEGISGYGLSVFSGWNGNPDQQKAFQLFEKAAMSGDSMGCHMAGSCLIWGYGTARDPKRGAALVRKAVMKGDMREAEYLLSTCYEEGIGVKKDSSKAFVYLWKAACGNTNAAYDLVIHYIDGKKVPQNLKEAAFWANRSAWAGHPGAQCILAQFCLRGAGVPMDRARGIRLLKAAAMQGYDPAAKLLQEIGEKP